MLILLLLHPWLKSLCLMWSSECKSSVCWKCKFDFVSSVLTPQWCHCSWIQWKVSNLPRIWSCPAMHVPSSQSSILYHSPWHIVLLTVLSNSLNVFMKSCMDVCFYFPLVYIGRFGFCISLQVPDHCDYLHVERLFLYSMWRLKGSRTTRWLSEERCLLQSLMTGVHPRAAWWKKRTNFQKLSFDLDMCAISWSK